MGNGLVVAERIVICRLPYLRAKMQVGGEGS